MIKPFRLHVQNLRSLEAGPLAPHLASFAALLAQQRYCRVTGWNKLRLEHPKNSGASDIAIISNVRVFIKS